jgi:hypothetical protein
MWLHHCPIDVSNVFLLDPLPLAVRPPLVPAAALQLVPPPPTWLTWGLLAFLVLPSWPFWPNFHFVETDYSVQVEWNLDRTVFLYEPSRDLSSFARSHSLQPSSTLVAPLILHLRPFLGTFLFLFFLASRPTYPQHHAFDLISYIPGTLLWPISPYFGHAFRERFSFVSVHTYLRNDMFAFHA